MVNYQLGKIYKLQSEHSAKIYIGSTCKKYLSERKATHVSDYKRYRQGKTNYLSSFEIMALGDYDIELLENFPCESKDELLKKEKELIRLNKDIVVNINNPIMSKEEHKVKQSERRKTTEYKVKQSERRKTAEYKIKKSERDKRYRSTHIDKNKQYYEDNKGKLADKSKQYREANKGKLAEKSKLYREANSFTLANKKKLYRVQNREKISKHDGKKILCACGKRYTLGHKTRHLRTKQHQLTLIKQGISNHAAFVEDYEHVHELDVKREKELLRKFPYLF